MKSNNLFVRLMREYLLVGTTALAVPFLCAASPAIHGTNEERTRIASVMSLYDEAWQDLGLQYEGEGQYALASTWYRLAAGRGNIESIAALASLNRRALGIPKGVSTEKYWYNLAEQSDAEAIFVLGLLHEFGVAVPKDRNKSNIFYTKAASLGNVASQLVIGEKCLVRGAERKTFQKAAEWFRKAAAQGDVRAMNRLGEVLIMYSDNVKDRHEAVTMFSVAAAKSYGKSQYNLAECYLEGIGVQRDLDKALMLAKKSDLTKTKNAAALIARVCMAKALSAKDGRTRIACGQDAVSWAETGIEQRSDAAAMVMGELYRTGIGVEKNPEKALEYFYAQAQEKKSTEAMAVCLLGAPDALSAPRWEGNKAYAMRAGLLFEFLREQSGQAAVAVALNYQSGSGAGRYPAKAAKWKKTALRLGCWTWKEEMLWVLCDIRLTLLLSCAGVFIVWLFVRKFLRSKRTLAYNLARAKKGNRHAAYNLGILFKKSGNPEESRKWFTVAAEAGDCGAFRKLIAQSDGRQELFPELRRIYDATPELGVNEDFGSLMKVLEARMRAASQVQRAEIAVQEAESAVKNAEEDRS